MSIDTTPLSSTPRTTLRRHRERGVTDRADLYEVLDAGLICHLGVIADGAPVVVPTAYGTATLVRDDDQRWQALRIITDQLIPGRWAAARQPTKKELAATAVLSLPLTQASVKVRTGMPKDEPEDYGLDVWAGVLPMAVTF